MEGDERKTQLGAARYIAARFLARRDVDVDSVARFLPFWDAPSPPLMNSLSPHVATRTLPTVRERMLWLLGVFV